MEAKWKVVITDKDYDINDLLEEGWMLDSITAGSDGKFCFLLWKS